MRRAERARRQRLMLLRILIAVLVILVLVLGIRSCFSNKGEEKDAGQAPVEETENTPSRSEADQAQLDQDIADGYLILVNKSNFLPENYIPEDLEGLKYYAADRSADARFLRKTAADHFHEMCEAASAEGIDIVSTTAYRSYAFQKDLYEYYVSTKGQEEADKVSAKPGSSEHQTGLCADLSTSEIDYVNGSAFGDTAAGRWVAEHCHEYGFIVRYPDGLEGITGYTYEPWHVRYVGTVAAGEIHNENITLEEYIAENNIQNVDIVEPQSEGGE